MAPRLQLEKAAWRWVETVRPEEIRQEHIELAYRVNLPACKRGTCRRNCKGNPNCLVGIGEQAWLGEIDENAFHNIDDPNSERRDKNTFVGLTNLGATCYVNTFLQVWFHNLELRRSLYQCHNSRAQEHNIESDYEPQSICEHLQYLFALLQNSNRKYIDPSGLVKALGLDTGQQQDAQEFSKLFLSLLEDTLSKQKSTNLQNVIQRQFCGQFSYVTVCNQCGRSSALPSRFYELELNIQGHKNLTECVTEFLKEEKLDGENRYFCESCQSKQNATRRIKLHSLPPTLNLQLMRFVFDRQTGHKKKLNTFISFPEQLDMGPFLEGKPDQKCVYELSAVLIHRGISAYSGHYIAHVKDARTGDWYKFNDEEIEKMEGKKLQLGIEEDIAETVKSQARKPKCSKGYHCSRNAYMLVYKVQEEESSDPSMTNVEVPAFLQRLVDQDNHKFEEWCSEMADMRKQSVDKGKAKHEEVKELYELLPARDGEPYEFIPLDWLKKWLEDSTATKEIDNSLFLCSHGKLHPDKVGDSKRVSMQAAQLLYERYGGRPRLDGSSLCRECVGQRCRVLRLKNQLNEDYKEVSNLVKRTLTQPEWLQVMSDSEVEISSELHWSCVAAGKPRPSVRWLRNGQPLSTQDRVEVNGARLKISNLALEDSGMYQCVAENKHGTIYSTSELRVQVQAPDFRLNPVRKLIPAARGGQVMIECRPRAAPKPSLFWSRGTELLTNSTRVTVTPDGILWIHNISRADEGKYTCFAENYLGKANSTGHLSVRDATKITLAPSNADINQGEDVTLQCHASHDPTMDLTFTWALNGVLLDLEDSAGPYHRVEGKENIGDLLIVNAQLSQAGMYTCTAQTVVDSASASAKLVVRGPPGPPGGLLVKNVAETSVELRWSRGYDNHSPIGKYVIMGRSSLSSEWKKMRTDPVNIEGNAESARVMGLMPWMDYEFQVIASNILGSGEPSMPSHTIRTQQAAPTVAPSGLGGGGGDRNELIATWTPMAREYQNGDGFGYILAFRKKDTSFWTVVRIPHVESSRYVYYNDSLTPYSPFEVKIKAYNRRGEGPFSQIAVVHSAEEEPTVGPSNLNATALTAFEIQVSWEPVQHLSANGILRGYEIRYWRQHEREAAADRVRTAGLETTARVSGLRPSTRYHVAVLAYNSAGTGPPSPRTTVTTRKPPPNRRPGNVSWKTDGSWVTVRWDHVKAMHNESAVLGYKVLYKHEGQTALKVLDKAKTSVSLPLPKDNGYVVLEIRSWGEGGDGPAHEIIVSRDSGTGMMVQNKASSTLSCPLRLLTGLALLTLVSLSGL